jgi:hypothetical protein
VTSGAGHSAAVAIPGKAKGIWKELSSERSNHIGSEDRLGNQGFCLESFSNLSLDLPLVPICTFEPDTIPRDRGWNGYAEKISSEVLKE